MTSMKSIPKRFDTKPTLTKHKALRDITAAPPTSSGVTTTTTLP